jgi:light-regulated signal transduction histidine kinase (bacteriophytochrome)
MISESDILNASILIVDDQEVNVSLLEDLLLEAGYVSVTSTKDPREVCELYRKHRYSLILLDLLMPGLDGFQVMEGLKEIETDGYLPVLVQTAQPSHKLRALKAGAKDFVSKPFDLAEVLLRVHNLLEVRLLHKKAESQAEEAMRDVVEHKRMEAQISVLNAELEERVVDRTAQLQSANNELQAFSYSVSHDLRAPLRHVIAFVEILKDDARSSLSANNFDSLTTISKAAHRMRDLIDDLLAFSRLGHSEIRKIRVNLNQLVREVLGDFQEETKERSIAWDIHPLQEVWADRALLRMALVNLISNAVKFTGARAQAKIEINCAPASDGETAFFIRDNGAGFDPRYAGKLFGVFQRLHSQDKFEGTGIGLANVQRIIHRHGGKVWAEGVLDGGATFHFSIPKPQEGIKKILSVGVEHAGQM